jgi:hypothetical protein
MTRASIAAMVAFSLAGPVGASPWTERYFGVGSGGDRGVACGQARDHAQGNSFRACVQRHGKRTDAIYTDCICASAEDRIHVCNVNLKVSCEGPTSPVSDPGSLKSGGEPKGRADRRRESPSKAQRGGAGPPGPKVSRAGG